MKLILQVVILAGLAHVMIGCNQSILGPQTLLEMRLSDAASIEKHPGRWTQGFIYMG